MKLNKEQQKEERKRKLATFNPNENGLSHQGIFGLPFGTEEAQIVLLPVPWEVTVSYGEGTANGPAAILKASQQIDLYDPIYPAGWKAGIAMEDVSPEWTEANGSWRGQTVLYLHEFASAEGVSPQAGRILEDANKATADLMKWISAKTSALLEEGKFVGLIGGEHSVPLGYMQTLGEKYGPFGILQIDAHADLRVAYEGFTHSHASIMYNASQIPEVEKLVQVGIRDFSTQEFEYARDSGGKLMMFTDYELKKLQYQGIHWNAVCEKIIAHLPQQVYISFDIDGLQPWLCPNTGTPVAGGLLMEEAFYLLEKVVESGRKIIGFDLCEVAPGEDEWDGNVGSRVLYKLCLLAAKSNQMEME
jgi:agmatinase